MSDMRTQSSSEQGPTVSVCVTCYNQEAYIGQCLDGILAQKLDFPIEILVGDDCSTDGSAEIVEGYCRRDSRTVLVERPANLGFVANQRDLFQRARGEFVALVEGDDYWVDPDKLTRQVSMMAPDPGVTLCFTAGVKVSENGEQRLGVLRMGGPSRELGLGEVIRAVDGRVPTASMLMRRSALMKLPAETYDQSPIDYALQVLVGAQGRIWYDASVTSAYRVLSTGSWTEGMATDADKYLKHHESLRRYQRFLQGQLGPAHDRDLRRAFEPLFLGFYMSSRIRAADKRRNLALDLPLLSRRGRTMANVLARAPVLVRAGAFARRRIWRPFLRPLFARTG